MNSLSSRERRLIVVLGSILLIVVAYLFLGGGDGEVIGVPDVGQPTPVVTSPAPSGSPTFVIPPGARDPFGGGPVPQA